MIFRAALVLFAGWVVYLVEWRFISGDLRLATYAVADAVQALAFFYMSRRRWFPVPLFFLFAAQVLYHSYAALVGAAPFLVAAFLNRAYETALAYVGWCSAYRMLALRDRRRSAVAETPNPLGGLVV